MNPKIEKMSKDIEKTREKIAEMQAKLRDLERQKTELENTEYVAIIRNLNMAPQQLAEFIKENGTGRILTAPDFRPDDTATASDKEDLEDEE